MMYSTTVFFFVFFDSLTEISVTETSPNGNKRYQLQNFEWTIDSDPLPKSVIEEYTNFDFVSLSKKHGYPAENHYVTTTDGYVLQINRLPHGRSGRQGKRKGVVYMQHGLLLSAMDWVLAGPEKGFGFILADSGYDVWLGNARGTRYSKNNTRLSADSKEFWDFSWHEIAMHDIPTMIDYVLAKTNEKQVTYIGHSQGTTVFYIMCSERPEYNRKIKNSFSLAPVAFMKHVSSPLLKFVAFFDGSVWDLLMLIGMHEFIPTHSLLHNMGKIMCTEVVLQPFCSNSMFLMLGFDAEQLNITFLPIIVAHVPAGASSKQIMHYSQLVNARGILEKARFRQFDYGADNKKFYNQPNPPDYNLRKVTAPTYLMYSNNDYLAHPLDVAMLKNQLGNCRLAYLIPYDKFNHVDHLYGIDAPDLLYKKVINLMEAPQEIDKKATQKKNPMGQWMG